MTFEMNGSGAKALGWVMLAISLLCFGILIVTVQFDEAWKDNYDIAISIVMIAGLLSTIGGVLMLMKGAFAQGLVVTISGLMMVILGHYEYLNYVALIGVAIVMVMSLFYCFKQGETMTLLFGIVMLIFLAIECVYWKEWVDFITNNDAITGAIGILAGLIATCIAYKAIDDVEEQ